MLSIAHRPKTCIQTFRRDFLSWSWPTHVQILWFTGYSTPIVREKQVKLSEEIHTEMAQCRPLLPPAQCPRTFENPLWKIIPPGLKSNLRIWQPNREPTVHRIPRHHQFKFRACAIWRKWAVVAASFLLDRPSSRRLGRQSLLKGIPVTARRQVFKTRERYEDWYMQNCFFVLFFKD